VIATAHLLSTATFDLFFWSLLCLLVLRLLRTRDERLWLAIGVTTGVALLNKYNVVFLLAALGLALLTNRQHRPLLRSWWFVGGGAIAAVVITPNVVWNAQHDWAAVSMLQSLRRENSTLGASLGFLPSQVFIVGPVLAAFWVAGLRRLFSHACARVFAVAYIVLLTLDTLSGAKPYYLTGIYFALFAGGGLWYEERIARTRRGRPGRTAAIFVVAAVAAFPLALPVLPASAQPAGPWLGNINKDLSATLGWKPFVRQVAALADTLPAAERRRLVVFAGDYGAAGAIDLFGARYGLPHAISGHNNYWWWGPGRAPDDSTTIAVNIDRSFLQTIFAGVEAAGQVRTPGGVWSEERDAAIYLCRGQRRSWAAGWPSARHYG
jgi:4-amino-4-deoxy-L-arabinose transferase-like glycosyltransferase